MELEKEIIDLKVQLGIALALANKALDMAIQSQVEVQVAKETQVKRIEIPEPTPAMKEFMDEIAKPDQSEAVPQIKEKLSPFTTSMLSMRRTEAKGIDEVATIGEDEDSDAIWDATVEGGM